VDEESGVSLDNRPTRLPVFPSCKKRKGKEKSGKSNIFSVKWGITPFISIGGKGKIGNRKI